MQMWSHTNILEVMGVYIGGTTRGLTLPPYIANIIIYKSFASICYIYLEAALIPEVQNAISNLSNPYLRSTTILLDKRTHSNACESTT